MCFGYDDKSSLENIESWSRSIENHAKKDIVKMLVGNKCDMPEESKTV